jgi:hypothetical protein
VQHRGKSAVRQKQLQPEYSQGKQKQDYKICLKSQVFIQHEVGKLCQGAATGCMTNDDF